MSMRLSFIVMVVSAISASARAAIIVSHVDDNDPTTESPAWVTDPVTPAWTVTGGTEGAGPNAGVKYWEINNPGTSYGEYVHDLTPTDFAGSWAATATVRVVSPGATAQDISLIAVDGSRRYLLGFRSDGLYRQAIGNVDTLVSAFTLDTDHYYEVTMAKNIVSGDVDVYLDGVLQTSIVPSTSPFDSRTTTYWGDDTTSNASTSRWSNVAFNTDFSVPEPASASVLMALGAAGLLRSRRAR